MGVHLQVRTLGRVQLSLDDQPLTALLSRFANVFPMARPRHHLLAGRVAALHGNNGRARREFQKALQLAEQMDTSWDANQARRRLGRSEGVDVPAR